MKVQQLSFDAIELSAMTWKEFKTRYFSSIRVSNDVWGIKPVSIELIQATNEMDLWGVWYEGGTWRDGENVKLEIGNKMVVVRIPVFKIEKTNDYLVVDGMHRITKLKPSIILMDVVNIKDKDKVYINDMMFW